MLPLFRKYDIFYLLRDADGEPIQHLNAKLISQNNTWLQLHVTGQTGHVMDVFVPIATIDTAVLLPEGR